MFLDPLGGEILDFVGGRADLDARVLRAIGDPAARFAEDKLRLLRAARFAARFGCAIEAATRGRSPRWPRRSRVVAAERIAQELRKMLVHPSRLEAMDLAMETGLMAAVLPAGRPDAGLPQGKPVQPDGDLWDHTRLVLDLLPADPSSRLAFAALLHDVGKPDTQAVTPRAGHLPQPRAGRPGDRRPDRPRPEAGQRRARADRLAGRVPPVSRRADRPPRGQAQADPRRAGDRRPARPPPRRCPGHDRRRSHVDYCEAYLRDQPAGPINPPRSCPATTWPATASAPAPGSRRYLELVYEAQLDRLVGEQTRGPGMARPPPRRRGRCRPLASGRPGLNAVVMRRSGSAADPRPRPAETGAGAPRWRGPSDHRASISPTSSEHARHRAGKAQAPTAADRPAAAPGCRSRHRSRTSCGTGRPC